MLYLEYSKFACPSCEGTIDVARNTQQDLIHRLEKPKPFLCPHCGAQVILDPKTTLFRAGLIGFIVLPSLLLLVFGMTVAVWIAMFLSGMLLIYTLLSNKLVCVEEGKEQRMNTNSWSISIEPNWQMTEDSECVTIYNDNGVGALQISSARKISGMVTQEDLDFYNKPEWGVPEKCVAGEFSGQRYTFAKDGHYWTWWIVGKNSTLLRITYNCLSGNESFEDQSVKSMLNSLKYESA